jgi:S-DNA-T family DNA segregation ATPase FtsK/SpoIIIE
MFLGSFWGSNISIGSIHGGGYIGRWLFSIAYKYLNFGGIILLWIFLVVLGVQLMFLFLWKDFFQRSIDVVSSIKAKTSKIIGKKTLKNVPEFLPNNKSNKPKINNTKKQNIPSSSLSEKGNDKQRKHSPAQESPTPDFDNKKYPPVDLLDPIQEEKEEIESGYFEDLSNRLIACLKDFGIEGELLNIKPGPVVTMFEFRPAPGIKISRIAQLNSDLALAMKAIAVRIEAPIPGKDYIGIEIPNKKRKVVEVIKRAETIEDIFKTFVF